MEKNLAYWSTIRGITEHKTGKDTVYYGLVFSYPKEEILKGIPPIEEAMMQKVDQLTSGEATEKDGGFVPNGVVERCEVLDMETDHVAVMYRVPYQRLEDLEGYESLTLRTVGLMMRIDGLDKADLLALKAIIDAKLAT